MIEDTIEIKYPVDKLLTDEFDGNQRRVEIREVTIEYVLRSGEKEIPSVYLRKARDVIQANVDNESLAMVDLIANEVLSFDTCFRLFLALQKTDFQITPQLDLIGKNHITISNFINSAEKTIWSINYYSENIPNRKQLSNNSILDNFITQHAKMWASGDIGNEYKSMILNDMELDEDDRVKLAILLQRLDNYSQSSFANPRRAPYYIYEQMAAIVDKDFCHKRHLLRTLHRVAPGSVGNSKLFTCFVLNVRDFREYIRHFKAVFIRFVESKVNDYLSASLSETDIAAVEIIQNYLNRENNTNYQKRYSWNNNKPNNKPDGCVGLLISPNNNFFSFSGYKDVKDPELCKLIPGSDKLSTLIESIKEALSPYGFEPEITNSDERFYDRNTSTFYDLKSDLQSNKENKPRYQCAEKKLLSHVYNNFKSTDNNIIITTFPPCSERGCQDLINEYRKTCKSIRTFCIGDYNTGKIIEC